MRLRIGAKNIIKPDQAATKCGVGKIMSFSAFHKSAANIPSSFALGQVSALKRNLNASWLFAFFSCLMAWLVLFPTEAFAQATSLGGMACAVRRNLGSMPPLLSGFSYVMGLWFIMTFGFKIRDHVDNAQQNPLHAALWRLGVGGLLLSLPAAVHWVMKTLYPSVTGAGAQSCAGAAATAAGASLPLDQMLALLMRDLANPMITLINVISWVIGLYLVLKGLRRAANYGSDPRTNGMIPIVSTLGLGAILLALPTSLNATWQTLFGTGTATFTTLSYVPAAGFTAAAAASFNNIIKAAFSFIYVVGLLAFVRGWIVVRDKVEGTGQAGFSAGFTHILGGVMAMNLSGVITMLQSTMGITILQVANAPAAP